MNLQIPFRLKWLGSETAEVCRLISSYQPLIYISPVPALSPVPEGMVRLPGAVFSRWDLRVEHPLKDAAGRAAQHRERDIVFDTTDRFEESRAYASIYDLYFKVYVKQTAFGLLAGTTSYSDVEALHRKLLERRVALMTRAFSNSELVGGCLIAGLHDGAGDAAGCEGEASVAAIDLLCGDVRLRGAGLIARILAEAARQARRLGFTCLQTNAQAPLAVSSANQDFGWLPAGEAATIAASNTSALLYCDLNRCSYLARDIYFYEGHGGTLSVTYVANEIPGAASALAFLNSIAGLDMRVYTRKERVHRRLSEMNVEHVTMRE